MLHTYREAITGKVYQVYDDEPTDRDDDEDDEEEEEEEEADEDFEESPSHYEHELERYYRWLYGE